MAYPADDRARTAGVSAIDELVALLRGDGYTVIGPTIRDGVVELSPVSSLEDLPVGWTDRQEAASYRLERSESERAVFGFSNGPASWKRYLHPPRERIWTMSTDDGIPIYHEDPPTTGAMAFLGVRACDLAAIEILDRVMADDPRYQARRDNVLIIAVNCRSAGATCFCASMDTGPTARSGYDLAITELIADGRHDVLLEAGSDRGEAVLGRLTTRDADPADRALAAAAHEQAIAAMGRQLETDGLAQAIAHSAESRHWDEVAERCLTCGNCTMVCPTCYCSDIIETADLTGDNAERWRQWESCFTVDFSHLVGGSVRVSASSRYRQWLTHKMSAWVDQFGTYGCVGCGRCITWCPVGIDITAEATAVANDGGRR